MEVGGRESEQGVGMRGGAGGWKVGEEREE